MMRAHHGVDTCRELKMVLQNTCAEQRPRVGTVHRRAAYHTVMTYEVKARHVLCLLVSAANRQAVTMAHARAKHFVLPVYVSTGIVGQQS